MRIRLVLLALMMLMFSGCSMQNTNAMIAQANADRFKAFADGMIGCKDDASCKVALSMAFAGNIGQQAFVREETLADYLRAGMPYGEMFIRLYGMSLGGGSGNQGGVNIIGNGNMLSDVGNRTKVFDQSSFLKTAVVSKYEEHNTNLGSGSATVDKSQKTELAPPVEIVPATGGV